jgi:hypothetical protein
MSGLSARSITASRRSSQAVSELLNTPGIGAQEPLVAKYTVRALSGCVRTSSSARGAYCCTWLSPISSTLCLPLPAR